MKTAWGVLLLSLCVSADMMDVIEKHKVPPASCKHGCEKWSAKDAKIWANGKVPANAGSYCAQPGAAVNDYKYGSWCYCIPGRMLFIIHICVHA